VFRFHLFRFLDGRLDPVLGVDRFGEVAVRAIAIGEEPIFDPGIIVEVGAEGLDFVAREAALEVRANVVRLGRRGVVDVAADVEIVEPIPKLP